MPLQSSAPGSSRGFVSFHKVRLSIPLVFSGARLSVAGMEALSQGMIIIMVFKTKTTIPAMEWELNSTSLPSSSGEIATHLNRRNLTKGLPKCLEEVGKTAWLAAQQQKPQQLCFVG